MSSATATPRPRALTAHAATLDVGPRPGQILAAGLATALAVVLLLVWPAGTASAHEKLIGSTPAAGSVVQEAPTEVTLNFSGELLPFGAAVIVADAAGTEYQAAGEPAFSGDDVIAQLEPGMPDGSYEIRWQVITGDGHPISGIVPFSIGEASAAEGDAGDDEAADDQGQPWWRTAGIAVAALGLVVSVFLLLKRRRAAAAAGGAKGQ